jgi:hypothetical protein
MQLRTQINKLYRVDAVTAHPVTGVQSVSQACSAVFGNLNDRTYHEVNTQCFTNTAFAAFTTHIWNHEDLHLNAAVAAAKVGPGNLVKNLGPLVGFKYLTLADQANARYFAAQNAVLNAAIGTHTHTSTPFNFYAYLSSTNQWVATQHNAIN